MKYLIILFLIVSCSPTRHYKFIATDTKTTEEQKRIIAPRMSILFPPRVQTVPGEVIIKRDTIVDVEALYEMNDIIDSLLLKVDEQTNPIVNMDSLKKAFLALCKPVRHTIEKTRIDTIFEADTKRESALIHELTNCTTSYQQLEQENKSLTTTVDRHSGQRRKLWFWIIILAVGLAGSIFLHFKR